MMKRPLALAVALMLGGSTAVLAQQQKSQDRPDTPNVQRPDTSRSAGTEQRGPANATPNRSESREGRREGRQENSQRGHDDVKAPAARKQDNARSEQRQPAEREQRANRQDNQEAAEREDRRDSQRSERRRAADKGNAKPTEQRSSQKNDTARKNQDQARTKRDDRGQPPMKGKRAREDSADAGGTPQWNDGQQQRVRESFQRNRTKMRHHTNVNVDISIGRRAPRNWTYYVVPNFVVELAPRYRGYRYAWVDNRYVIVHPKTYEVVAYIDAGTGRIYAGSAGGSGGACRIVDLSTGQRQRVIAAIDVRDRHDLSGVRIGFELPGRIALRSFPSAISRDFDRLANCRYVVLSDGRIAVVAPGSREIVAILDR